MNASYLEGIKRNDKFRKEYEKKSRSYQKEYYSNYGGASGNDRSGMKYSNLIGDKDMLKKFYRTLSKAFHPDSNLGKDTSGEMKLLNQLKDDWGV